MHLISSDRFIRFRVILVMSPCHSNRLIPQYVMNRGEQIAICVNHPILIQSDSISAYFSLCSSQQSKWMSQKETIGIAMKILSEILSLLYEARKPSLKIEERLSSVRV